MITKRIDFNLTPLQIHISMTTVGSVPMIQGFNANTNEYAPNYENTPLVIQPIVGIIDKDGILPAGRVNDSLTNITWTEIVEGESTVINSLNEDYVMELRGENAGRIHVYKNVAPGSPITLMFSAVYIDKRTRQIYSISHSVQIRCKESTEIPVLTLGTASHVNYDPLINDKTHAIVASLKEGKLEVPSENRIFVWQKQRSDGSWSDVGADAILDYDVVVSEDSTTATVDKELIGDFLAMRCMAKYSTDGHPENDILSGASPQVTVTFKRRLQDYKVDIADVPTSISMNEMYVYPRAVATGPKGIITNIADEVQFLFYAARNRESGEPSYTLVGAGEKATIETSLMDINYGMLLAVNDIDRGGWSAIEDENGDILVDENGDVIIMH